MAKQNRRNFLKKSGAGVLGLSTAPMIVPHRAYSANDKIIFGAIGLGGRGSDLVGAFAYEKNVQFDTLCDPDGTRAQNLFEMLKDGHNENLKRVQDYRRIMDNKDIDAVIVATPDHWHALPTITACQVGKDVYVEKPASHNIWEGRQMVKAARKYKRIVQVGTQTRSAPYAIKALEYIQSGKLGKIPLCKIYNLKSGGPVKQGLVSDIPDDVDWDLWLGAAAMRPFRPSTMRKNWLFYWDFCGGDMGNDGIHQIDLARMLIGKDYPKSVQCYGGNLAFDDDREVTDTQVATFDFDDMVVTFELTQYAPYMAKTSTDVRESDTFPHWPLNATRIELYGTEGLMIVGRHGGGWQVFSKDGEVVAQEFGRTPNTPHRENFLECIRTRKLPTADIEEGHRSAILSHLGNISYRVGMEKLDFDASSETFLNNDEANRLLKREYREPYAVPEEV